jgi:hypothetical protein
MRFELVLTNKGFSSSGWGRGVSKPGGVFALEKAE